MTLIDKDGNKVVSRTTSPDIIVASIRAFEKGFNILYAKEKLLESRKQQDAELPR